MKDSEHDQKTPDKLVRFADLSPYTGGMSRTTVHEWVKANRFPAPLKIGMGRTVAWRESDLKKWQDASQPAGASQ